MEKYHVLQQISNYSPTIVRSFKNEEDAVSFMHLMEKSERTSYTLFCIAKII